MSLVTTLLLISVIASEVEFRVSRFSDVQAIREVGEVGLGFRLPDFIPGRIRSHLSILVEDAGLEAVKEPLVVRIKRVRLSAKTLNSVARLQTVKDLDIRRCVVDSSDLQCLSAMQNLESLRIVECRLTGESLAFVSNLRTLRYLSLEENLIGNDVPDLSELSKLEHLNLRGNPISTNGIRNLRLANIPTLQKLNLSSTQIGNDVFPHFGTANTVLLFETPRLTLDATDSFSEKNRGIKVRKRTFPPGFFD